MTDLLIATNILLVLITGGYAYLTYRILKSNEKIAKLNLDPILWVNLFSDDGIYIKKLKKYPAYNVIMEFSVKVHRFSKVFDPIAEYYLGGIIEKEKIFSIDFEERIEEYMKKKDYKKCAFFLKCVIKYNLGIDRSFIERVEYLYGNAEEVEEGEIALSFSYEKNPSFDSVGNIPKKIVEYKY